MKQLLVVYGTTEGQTAKIAASIADVARELGLEATARHAPDVDDADLHCDAVIVGGSLHEGRYQRTIRDFVTRHEAFLSSRPSAFFSVSLAAASRDADERAEPLRIAKEFVAAAGWAPAQIASFAGALKYTQYSWLKRALMKHIAAKEGGDTDTSHDFEYTSWDDVAQFTKEFVSRLD